MGVNANNSQLAFFLFFARYRETKDGVSLKIDKVMGVVVAEANRKVVTLEDHVVPQI